MLKNATLLVFLLWLATAVHAHVGAFHKGMYCINGPRDAEDLNSNAIVSPLYQLDRKDWWFHAVDGCDRYPPPDGSFLDLPAGGSFMIEIASNRAKTSLSYNGRDMSDWPDGATYPENYNKPDCITSPNFHTQNQTMASGTAFAISYHSNIRDVTPESLVVFTTRDKTPWKRVVHYDVPAALPACPPDGCICAWGWVPNGCGQPNIYHQAFKCRVTGATSTTPVAPAKPPVWCEGNPDACTKGPKQMIYWNQLNGNNIQVSGYDRSGQPKTPVYNMKLGFVDGAQNDIFAGPPTPVGNGNSSPPADSSPSPSPVPASSPAPAPAPAASQGNGNADSGYGGGYGNGNGSSDPDSSPAPATQNTPPAQSTSVTSHSTTANSAPGPAPTPDQSTPSPANPAPASPQQDSPPPAQGTTTSTVYTTITPSPTPTTTTVQRATTPPATSTRTGNTYNGYYGGGGSGNTNPGRPAPQQPSGYNSTPNNKPPQSSPYSSSNGSPFSGPQRPRKSCSRNRRRSRRSHHGMRSASPEPVPVPEPVAIADPVPAPAPVAEPEAAPAAIVPPVLVKRNFVKRSTLHVYANARRARPDW